jgi:hypothetical protein
MTRFGRGAAAAALLLLANASADDSALPPVQQAGDISYISGGVGFDESDAMKAVAAKYSLEVTFAALAEGRSAYAFPKRLTVVKANGAPVLDITPDGPLLLLDLRPGKYRVTAVNEDQSKTQAVEIAPHVHKKLGFEWMSPQTK